MIRRLALWTTLGYLVMHTYQNAFSQLNQVFILSNDQVDSIWKNNDGIFSVATQALFQADKYINASHDLRKLENLSDGTISPLNSSKALESRMSLQNNRSVSRPLNVAIFFNVYLPDTSGRPIDIIKEQIGQISNSYAARLNVTVYFITVSRTSLNISDTFFQQICDHVVSRGKINCERVGDHVQDGGELDTLQALHDYCVRTSVPDVTTRVVYIHNKGSFHYTQENNYWRQAMTSAVMDQRCLDPPDDSCNVCGLTYATPPRMFTMMFPGNFFAASCDYVKQLLPPKLNFKAKHGAMLRKLRQDIKSRNMTWIRPPKKAIDWSMGRNRYTAEHWVGLHPTVQPCDLSMDPNYWYWQSERNTTALFNFSMYPRQESAAGTLVSDNPDERLRLFSLLPGLLWRMIYLYNSTPPESSWIWSFLPDGDFWKETIRQYGHGTHDMILAQNFPRNETWMAFHAKKGNIKKASR